MTQNITLRQKLHHYIETADEKQLKAFYTLMKKDIDVSFSTLSDEQKIELDERESKQNKSNFVSSTESKKRIEALLKK